MIEKKFVQDGQEVYVMVNFILPHNIRADSIHVVGDFNNWDRTLHPLWRDRHGRWMRSIILEMNRMYLFRYLVDREQWLNDNSADAFLHNPLGISSSVIFTDSEFERHQRLVQELPFDPSMMQEVPSASEVVEVFA